MQNQNYEQKSWKLLLSFVIHQLYSLPSKCSIFHLLLKNIIFLTSFISISHNSIKLFSILWHFSSILIFMCKRNAEKNIKFLNTWNGRTWVEKSETNDEVFLVIIFHMSFVYLLFPFSFVFTVIYCITAA